MIDDGPIAVRVSGASTREESEWAFDAANSWLRRDEPQVGQRYTYRECGWLVHLTRVRPMSVKAAFRHVTLADGEVESIYPSAECLRAIERAKEVEDGDE